MSVVGKAKKMLVLIENFSFHVASYLQKSFSITSKEAGVLQKRVIPCQIHANRMKLMRQFYANYMQIYKKDTLVLLAYGPGIKINCTIIPTF